MHICCGPCACYPVKKLRQDGIEPVGYFFNPNIHPYREWELRLKTAKDFAEKAGMEFLADENYRLRDFLRRALAAEDSDGKIREGEGARCRMCYAWRLNKAAEFAAARGFDAFSSTLFYSVHQQHEVMKEIACKAGQRFGIKFYYEDFRQGWQEGIDISRRLELYRQPYCGCVFSEEDRYNKALRKEKKKANRALKAARLAKEKVLGDE